VPTSAETVAKRGHYVKMQGRDVFRFATRVVPDSVLQALEQAGLTTDDIDLDTQRTNGVDRVADEVAGDVAWTFPVDAPAEVVAEVLAAALDTRPARLQGRVAAYDWSRVAPRIEEEVRLALA